MIKFTHTTKQCLFKFAQTTTQAIIRFAQTTRQKLFVFQHGVNAEILTREGIGYWKIESTFEVH